MKPITIDYLESHGFKKRGVYWKHPACQLLHVWDYNGEYYAGVKGDPSIMYEYEHQLDNLYLTLSNMYI